MQTIYHQSTNHSTVIKPSLPFTSADHMSSRTKRIKQMGLKNENKVPWEASRGRLPRSPDTPMLNTAI